ncbi:glycoside hydrolase family protein [Salix suchowensis]|nr:glycoside hydrolase family protein [Salix suchowensis]
MPRFTVSTNCDAAVNWNQGCGTRFAKANSYGAGFNSAGGGWFAMERSREDGVKVWFWSRLEDDVPRNIRDADALIDPSSFGMPSATFPKDSCDYDTHFNAHKMIFDTTLCGDWAGSEFSSTGILGGCDKLVRAHVDSRSSTALTCSDIRRLQHESVGREEGLTTEQLRIIRFTPPFVQTKHTESILGPQLSAAMSYADWITKSVQVPDRVFKGLKQFLNDQQIVEATMTAGSYNLVSRFVVALDADARWVSRCRLCR